MAEITTQYTLSATEKQEIAQSVVQSFNNGEFKYTLADSDKEAIVGEISDSLNAGTLSVKISDADKADIIAEVLAELYAKSQQVKSLERVGNLSGITTIPAVRDTDDAIVAVPLELVTTNQPIEVAGQDAIDILVAQGKIIPGQLYFTPVDEE